MLELASKYVNMFVKRRPTKIICVYHYLVAHFPANIIEDSKRGDTKTKTGSGKVELEVGTALQFKKRNLPRLVVILKNQNLKVDSSQWNLIRKPPPAMESKEIAPGPDRTRPEPKSKPPTQATRPNLWLLFLLVFGTLTLYCLRFQGFPPSQGINNEILWAPATFRNHPLNTWHINGQSQSSKLWVPLQQI